MTPLLMSPDSGSPLWVRRSGGHGLWQPGRIGPGGGSNRELVAAGDAGGRAAPLAGGVPASSGRSRLPGLPAARESHGELGGRCSWDRRGQRDLEAGTRGGGARVGRSGAPASPWCAPLQVPHRLLTLTLLPGLELCLLCGPRPPLSQLDPQVNPANVPAFPL